MRMKVLRKRFSWLWSTAHHRDPTRIQSFQKPHSFFPSGLLFFNVLSPNTSFLLSLCVFILCFAFHSIPAFLWSTLIPDVWIFPSPIRWARVRGAYTYTFSRFLTQPYRLRANPTIRTNLRASCLPRKILTNRTTARPPFLRHSQPKAPIQPGL